MHIHLWDPQWIQTTEKNQRSQSHINKAPNNVHNLNSVEDRLRAKVSHFKSWQIDCRKVLRYRCSLRMLLEHCDFVNTHRITLTTKKSTWWAGLDLDLESLKGMQINRVDIQVLVILLSVMGTCVLSYHYSHHALLITSRSDWII